MNTKCMNTKFGLKVQLIQGGSLELHPTRKTATLHDVKSVAGHMFHNDVVRSVCVYLPDGTVALYLRRNGDGTYHREENELLQ